MDSLPGGGGASPREIELLKMFIGKDIDGMLVNVDSILEMEESESN